MKILKRLKNLIMNERGQALSEYGVILGIVLVAVITVLALFGEAIVGVFNDIISSLPGGGG